MPTITDISQLDLTQTYSYADYMSWKFEQTLEIIRGKIFPMAGPSRVHQKISWQLSGIFFNYFKDKQCEVYAAPFDVRLYDKFKSIDADKDIYNVVQPDLCVICDLDKLDDRGCIGAPDLIVEILSPGNSKREMKIKKGLYAEAGVQEYWVIDPNQETLTQFVGIGENGNYNRPLIFTSDDEVVSIVFPDLIIDLKTLFPVV